MTPKQIEAAKKSDHFRPSAKFVLNYGDFTATDKDSQLLSARVWQGTRAEFAQAFKGISQSSYEPKATGATFQPLVSTIRGCLFLIECVGACPNKTPLGPVVKEDGSLDPQRLEACSEEEAIAYATEKANEVRVK